MELVWWWAQFRRKKRYDDRLPIRKATGKSKREKIRMFAWKKFSINNPSIK